MSDPAAAAAPQELPCPKGDGCALNKGARHCRHCGRNWPPDETWDIDAAAKRIIKDHGEALRKLAADD